MPHAVVGFVLVAHGLITTMIGFGSITNPSSAAMPVPSWLGWWPGTFGRSWLLDALSLGSGRGRARRTGLARGRRRLDRCWARLARRLGAQRRVADARVRRRGVGLVALALYFHPFYLIAVVIDVVIIAMVWGRLMAAR